MTVILEMVQQGFDVPASFIASKISKPDDSMLTKSIKATAVCLVGLAMIVASMIIGGFTPLGAFLPIITLTTVPALCAFICINIFKQQTEETESEE